MPKTRKSYLASSERHRRRTVSEITSKVFMNDDTEDCVGQEVGESDSDTDCEQLYSTTGDNLSSERQGENFEDWEMESSISESVSDISVEEFPPELEIDTLSALRRWAASGISHSKVNDLLKILQKHPCFVEWPSDVRSLINTPRVTQTQPIAGGDYYHWGVEAKLRNHLERYPNLQELEILKLHCCVDGLPLTKSTNSQLWPILLSFEDCFDIEPFVVGMFHGYSKPNSAMEYFQVFKEEMVTLKTTGLEFNGKKYLVLITAYILDTPAYSFATGTVSHTAYYSCRKCVTRGEYEVSNIAFNEFDSELRDDVSFRNQVQVEHHKSYSPLMDIPGTVMVDNFPYDYMHLTCLGVMRKILFYFLTGPFLVRLSTNIMGQISVNLVSIAKCIPVDFPRKPRTLKEMKRWKATELRQFMLYTGPYILKRFVSNDVYIHFLCFSFSMRCFVNNKYDQQRQKAEKLMKYFVLNFAKLYGRRSVSHNVHALIHLYSDVAAYGYLDKVNCFKFENKLQSIKKMVRKYEKPLQQIVRREAELSNMPPKMTNCSANVVARHVEGLPQCMVVPAYSKFVMKDFIIMPTEPNNCVILMDGSIVVLTFIAMKKDTNDVHIYGRKFKDVSDFYSSPAKSSNVGLFLAANLSTPHMWPTSAIRAKGLIIPFSQERGRQYYVAEIIHTHA